MASQQDQFSSSSEEIDTFLASFASSVNSEEQSDDCAPPPTKRARDDNEAIQAHREKSLQLKSALDKLTQKQRIDLVEGRTLSSIEEGSVLEFTTKAQLRKAVGSPTQTVFASIWLKGKMVESGVKMILPLRLSGGEYPFSKGNILVFMGKSDLKVPNGKSRNWCWHTHTMCPPAGKAATIAQDISILSLDVMKKRFARGTLERFKPGTILSIWSVKVMNSTPTSSSNPDTDTDSSYAAVQYSVETESKDGVMRIEEGEITLPGRFIPRLTEDNALPCHAIYEGKKKSPKTNREFHDLLFIDDTLVVQNVNEGGAGRKPIRSSHEAAGYDLHCSESFSINPWSRLLVPTGLRFFFPKGVYARIAPRSGLSLHGIDIGAGVIDRDYNGEVKVVVINNSSQAFHCKAGSRICQVILEKIITPDVIQLEANQRVNFQTSTRGEQGFGQFSGCI